MRAGLRGGLLAFACMASATASAQEPPFSRESFAPAELIAGKQISEMQCSALAGAVWVTVEGRGECIRYYYSNAGGGRDLLVYLHADLVVVNGRGEARPYDFYAKSSPASVQTGSINWSRTLKVPYLFLARPGTYGSSGRHSERRSEREIALISAALDRIKTRLGYSRLHLVGFGEGGHAAAALLARRHDLGCVALASALLSLRQHLAERGRNEDVTGNRAPLDPIASVGRITRRDDLRIVVMTDPDDVLISARSQTSYVRQAMRAGLPVNQIFPAAKDPFAHQLAAEARHVAAVCAKGAADAAIAALYDTKRPEQPPDAPDPPLHNRDTLRRGVSIDEVACRALSSALWLKVDGRGFCVRYFFSTAGGTKDEALVFLDGDIGATKGGIPTLNEPSARTSAGRLERAARSWSRLYGGPYVMIGRLGTLGSSGHHIRERRTLLEAKVAGAALDRLAALYGFRRLHLVGQSGGGHTVATLVQMRSDIRCAVITSGVVAVRSFERDRGVRPGPWIKTVYDPIDSVGRMQYRPGQRVILLSDPRDRLVSFRSQREFVDKVKKQNIPILQITAAAGDKDFHGLAGDGQRAAIDCAKDEGDDTLVERYGRRPPQFGTSLDAAVTRR